MPYCVNCGVELDKSLKSCPLCSTPVILPHGKQINDTPSTPLNRDELLYTVDSHLIASIASVILVLPCIITLICDFFGTGSITWSPYVIGACAWAFSSFCFPVLIKLKNLFAYIALFSICSALYLLLIGAVGGFLSSFFPLSLAIILSIDATLVPAIIICRKIKTSLARLCCVSFFLGILCLLTELSINYFLSDIFRLFWSLYCMATCAVIAGAFLLIDRKLKLKNSLHKRLFF